MNVLAFLVPLALFMSLIGLGAFIWTLKSGQYDDLDGEALRILDDDDDKPLPPKKREPSDTNLRKG